MCVVDRDLSVRVDRQLCLVGTCLIALRLQSNGTSSVKPSLTSLNSIDYSILFIFQSLLS